MKRVLLHFKFFVAADAHIRQYRPQPFRADVGIGPYDFLL